MENTEVVKTNNGVAVQPPKEKTVTERINDLMTSEKVTEKFKNILGKRTQGFITSVMQVVTSNELLKKAEPASVYSAAATAAVLDLPINNNLGFAYIVPYKDKDGNSIAQFQMGYKGFIQLAQRSGLFKTISVTEVYEGQLIEENPLTGFVFDFTKAKSKTIVGYAAYFELLNGFSKTLYMTKETADAHGKKYSQVYRKGFGLWKTDFDTMAMKTVLKQLLSKYAPLSIEMQRAVISDQAVIKDVDTMEVDYVDANVQQEIEQTPEPAKIEMANRADEIRNMANGKQSELEIK